MSNLSALPANLPNIAHAKLPEAYLAARTAIAECARVDECKTWADKAAAIASYAKQADDDTLYNHAVKIKARAIERCGALLAEFKPASGPQPKATGSGRFRDTRKDRAAAAGLSPRQQATALQVHSYASKDPAGFEAAVEAPKPATVTELAERGKRPAPKPLTDLAGRSPADFKAATSAIGALRFLADAARSIDPAAVVRGIASHERAGAIKNAKIGLAWVEKLITKLEK